MGEAQVKPAIEKVARPCKILSAVSSPVSDYTGRKPSLSRDGTPYAGRPPNPDSSPHALGLGEPLAETQFSASDH